QIHNKALWKSFRSNTHAHQTHTCIQTHTQTHTHTHTHTHTCTLTHTHTQTHTCIQTHTHTHIHTCVQTHTHTHTHAYTHTHTCVHTHTHIHMRTHTHSLPCRELLTLQCTSMSLKTGLPPLPARLRVLYTPSHTHTPHPPLPLANHPPPHALIGRTGDISAPCRRLINTTLKVRRHTAAFCSVTDHCLSSPPLPLPPPPPPPLSLSPLTPSLCHLQS